ncbi:MAG: hypothetical protein KJ583_04255 [Nanoarchaeota archaeon]|nr:hypothetical protein [Nanoarchaeota archaeon]MBU1269101.1 hypothetical protein [Nanoarchaeota archaeon]MBU1604505.1 hypothetical protein [Nanoarchaeota archaeon]MBU2443741.1 hypothetical protein [Nanoarchaeota archaeon]
MVTYLEMTGMSLMDVLGTLWSQFLTLLPGLFGALILLLIGYFLGVLFEAIIKGALLKAGLDDWIEKHERHHAIGKLSVSGIIGIAAKWYIFVLFLIPASALISMGSLSAWVHSLAMWLPKLIAGVLLFYFGLILADMAETAIESHKFKWAHFWGGFARIVIILFVLDIALKQIGFNIVMAETTYLIILTGIVLALAIAVGIGFGSALKDEAKGILKKLK